MRSSELPCAPGNAGQVNYSAAKAGIVGLTKTTAKEWGRYNLQCNCVCYGFIDTRLTAAKEQVELFSKENSFAPIVV